MRYTVVEKSRRRLMILIAGTLLLSGIGGVLFVINQWQITRQYQALRTRATQAISQGHYESAVDVLSHGLALWPDDRQLLADYVQAQVHLQKQSQQDMELTIEVLNRSLAVEPDMDEAATQLADLYLSSGDQVQALKVADRLLDEQSDNVQLRKRRALANAALKRFDTALADIDRCIELQTDHFDLYLLRLYLMKKMHQPQEMFLSTVEHWRESLGSLGRYQALMGIACRLIDLNDQAVHWLTEASNHAQDDGKLVNVLVHQLGEMKQYPLASALLERTEPGTDSGLLYIKAWWLWQHQSDASLLTLPHLDQPQIMALQLLALERLGRRQEMKSLLQAMKTISTQRQMQAWYELLQVHLADSDPEPLAIIELAQVVRQSSASHDLVDMIQAQQWEKLGEQDNALDSWRCMAMTSPTWDHAFIQQSRLLLAMGHPLAAADAARQALACNPTNVSASVLLINSLIAAQTPQTRETASTVFEQIQSQLDPVTRLMLGARLFETQAIPTLIKQARQDQVQLTQQDWLTLARISLERHADWHEFCLSHVKQQFGLTPQWLQLKAQSLLDSGKPLAARQMVVSLVNDQIKAHPKQAMDWQLVEARFLAALPDPLAAHLAFAHLLKQYPQSLTLAQSILDEPMQRMQPDLRLLAIEQLHRLTGELAIRWRREKAALILAESTDNASLASAALLMHQAVKIAPSSMDSRELLIQCLQTIGSVQGMQEQAQAILQVDPYHPLALSLMQRAQR